MTKIPKDLYVMLSVGNHTLVRGETIGNFTFTKNETLKCMMLKIQRVGFKLSNSNG